MARKTKEAIETTTTIEATSETTETTETAAAVAEKKAKSTERREKRAARNQELLTSALTRAVGLSQAVNEAVASPGIADRIEGLRGVIVNIETVRVEVSSSVKNEAFRASVEIIVSQAKSQAEKAWVAVLDEIRALEVE